MQYVKKIFIAVVITASLLSLPGALRATTVWNKAWVEIGRVGDSAGYSPFNRDLPLQIFVARVIAQVLTFIGIVFLILVVYAGLLWMTAAGKEEQLEKARKILTTAAVGLLIVILAYAITSFVMRAFLRGAGLDEYN